MFGNMYMGLLPVSSFTVEYIEYEQVATSRGFGVAKCGFIDDFC